MLLQGRGRAEEAEPLHRRALGARERALGPEHLETLASVGDLSALLQEAKPVHWRAL